MLFNQTVNAFDFAAGYPRHLCEPYSRQSRSARLMRKEYYEFRK